MYLWITNYHLSLALFSAVIAPLRCHSRPRWVAAWLRWVFRSLGGVDSVNNFLKKSLGVSLYLTQCP